MFVLWTPELKYLRVGGRICDWINDKQAFVNKQSVRALKALFMTCFTHGISKKDVLFSLQSSAAYGISGTSNRDPESWMQNCMIS